MTTLAELETMSDEQLAERLRGAEERIHELEGQQREHVAKITQKWRSRDAQDGKDADRFERLERVLQAVKVETALLRQRILWIGGTTGGIAAGVVQIVQRLME